VDDALRALKKHGEAKGIKSEPQTNRKGSGSKAHFKHLRRVTELVVEVLDDKASSDFFAWCSDREDATQAPVAASQTTPRTTHKCRTTRDSAIQNWGRDVVFLPLYQGRYDEALDLDIAVIALHDERAGLRLVGVVGNCCQSFHLHLVQHFHAVVNDREGATHQADVVGLPLAGLRESPVVLSRYRRGPRSVG